MSRRSGPRSTQSPPGQPQPPSAADIEASKRLSPTASRSRLGGSATGEAIGSALVGFDHAIFRATKPPAILVASARPVRGLAGEGGRLLSIEFPNEVMATDDQPVEKALAGGDEVGQVGEARRPQ